MSRRVVREVRRKSLKSLQRVGLPGGREVPANMLTYRANFAAGGVPISKDIWRDAARPISLDEIAYRIERLTPSSRNPERFHEEKSDIVACLLRLAEERRRG